MGLYIEDFIDDQTLLVVVGDDLVGKVGVKSFHVDGAASSQACVNLVVVQREIITPFRFNVFQDEHIPLSLNKCMVLCEEVDHFEPGSKIEAECGPVRRFVL